MASVPGVLFFRRNIASAVIASFRPTWSGFSVRKRCPGSEFRLQSPSDLEVAQLGLETGVGGYG